VITYRSMELRLNLKSVEPVTPGLDTHGIEGSKNCTLAHSPVMRGSFLSGVSVLRLAPFDAHARRPYGDGNLDMGGYPSGQSTNLAEWRLLGFPTGPQHLEPSSESSVLR
jgi:hypothetical protein